jgi:hypothetical protein
MTKKQHPLFPDTREVTSPEFRKSFICSGVSPFPLLERWMKYLLHFDGDSTREFAADLYAKESIPLPEFFEVWLIRFPDLNPMGLHLARKFKNCKKNEWGQPTREGVLQFYHKLDDKNRMLVNKWILENVRL